MKLFAIIIDWSYKGEKQDVDWVHVIEDGLSYQKAQDLARQTISNATELDPEDITLDNVYVNHVTVDGYTIDIKKKAQA